ncbi:hypothetical protein QYE76_055678 [Lolium multiflorum]|uniref:Reverse transcriptase domain-containing protein n=1 Tax=Lolium multiflorum TaxID=4521 RepID=A0AAD8T0R0_LOLMU|nr:hypothetical protein QYE76_055678 [Lolium multiflorum]
MRPVGEERRRAIAEEVNRLLAAGFIIEIKHPKWLANPVLVLKKNKTWRMCIDYTSLNRACPKDPFVLPRIDQIINAVAGSESLCLLDAYSGYNQIKMAKEDQEKTALITPLGAYCYTAMTFGLRNAGATYQLLSPEFDRVRGMVRWHACDPHRRATRRLCGPSLRGTGASRSPSHSRLYGVGQSLPAGGFDATHSGTPGGTIFNDNHLAPSTSEMAKSTPVSTRIGMANHSSSPGVPIAAAVGGLLVAAPEAFSGGFILFFVGPLSSSSHHMRSASPVGSPRGSRRASSSSSSSSSEKKPPTGEEVVVTCCFQLPQEPEVFFPIGEGFVFRLFGEVPGPRVPILQAPRL